jgi:glycosyl transferase family 1
MNQNATQLVRGSGGNVLLMSVRRIAQLVAYCLEYEFEGLIADLTGADRLDIGGEPQLELSRRLYKYTHLLTRSRRIARAASSISRAVHIDRNYELFFPMFNHAHEIPALAALPDWRKRSKIAACFISEIWPHQCPAYLLEMLEDFDHIFLGVKHSVDFVEQAVGRPCTYLPVATDVIRFAPMAESSPRPIDVCNIGRRSPVTHEALLRLATDPEFFYYYDTVAASGVDLKQRTFRVQDPREHRLLFASLLKRSRYFLANTGFINDYAQTRGQEEISGRFYEGAAAGTVMLGTAPATEEFRRQFDWLDAVVRVPFDCSEIGQVLDELNRDPQRIAKIRRNNVRNAALKHDFVHRLRVVFNILGIPPTDAMFKRENLLRALAAQMQEPARDDPPGKIRAV